MSEKRALSPLRERLKQHYLCTLLGFIVPNILVLSNIGLLIVQKVETCRADLCQPYYTDGEGLVFLLVLIMIMASWLWQGIAWLWLLSAYWSSRKRIEYAIAQSYRRLLLILLCWLIAYPFLMAGLYLVLT